MAILIGLLGIVTIVLMAPDIFPPDALVERQATYQHRQVSYHRYAAGEVRSAAYMSDIKPINVERRNWHGRS
jgi:hypothetical protein